MPKERGGIGVGAGCPGKAGFPVKDGAQPGKKEDSSVHGAPGRGEAVVPPWWRRQDKPTAPDKLTLTPQTVT